MGRTEPSVGRPPAAFRRDARAKQARATINQLIPSLLSAHPRARKGIDAAELIVDPPPNQPSKKPKDARQPTGKDTESQTTSNEATGPRISLQVADTLTAARSLLTRDNGEADLSNKISKVAILNMASPLSPGGGFLNGAGSQEESLCMRSTLLPSLKDEWYRLPELGAIFTPDVLVFREESDEALEKKTRWFVNCITAAMLRGPEIEVDDAGRGSYSNQKDRDLAVQKIRMVLRICQVKGIKKVVLGAWGCGAYGNPVGEVAAVFKRVLIPRKDNKGKQKGSKETWDGIEEVVFAIKDSGMADAFATAFGDGLLRDEVEESEEDDEDEEADSELMEKIRELEERIERTTNPGVKEGLTAILAGLKKQLPEQNSTGDDDESEGDVRSGSEDD